MPHLAASPHLVASALCCAVSVAPVTKAAEEKRNYNLPRGDAATTLNQFASVSGRQILYMMDKVRGVETNAVRGQYHPQEALERMLAGTSLVARRDHDTGAFVVSRKEAAPVPEPSRKEISNFAPPQTTEPTPNAMKHPRLLTRVTTWLALLAAPIADAQTTPAAAGNAGEEAIVLSPFTVNAEADVGYQAGNTTSGSRLNTSLRDTAASISAFTPEFLSDLALNNVAEMLEYATNAELGGDDAAGGFNNPDELNASGGTPPRIRGIGSSIASDYIETAIPQDNYNIDRVEVSSGPNSILFGSGSAGGVIALATKRADVSRNKNHVSLQFGSWGHERYAADLNRTLAPGVLAVRLMGLYQNSESWRRYEFNDSKRWTGAVTYKPFKRTTLSASYEDGTARRSLGTRLNLNDVISVWEGAGRPLSETANLAAGIQALGANQRYTYFSNDNVLFNMRNEFQTTTLSGTAARVNTDFGLLPVERSPYDVNWTGRSSYITQSFDKTRVIVEQRVTDKLVVELTFAHDDNANVANQPSRVGNSTPLYGDPNGLLTAPSGTGTVPNLRAGQLYLETNWSVGFRRTSSDVIRATAAYELDLGRWFGRHRLAGFAEQVEQKVRNRSRVEILVDQNKRPVANVNAPENAQNNLWRRNYVAEGDFAAYHVPAFSPVPPLTFAGNTLHSRMVNTSGSNVDSGVDIESLMIASQSYWWKNRLVTTFGARRDFIDYTSTGMARVTAGDGRVASGELLPNELAITNDLSLRRYALNTVTAGGVLHLTKRFSVFYNQSNNTSAPNFIRTVLPRGEITPPVKGDGRDYGVMVDLLGDGRFFARGTYFEVSRIGDANDTPSGTGGNATGLGRQQALRILDAFLAAGRLTQAQYDQQAFNYTSAQDDVVTKGYELELVANLTRNWTSRFGYSYSDRERTNFFLEGYAYYADRYVAWREMARGDAALTALVETNIRQIDDYLADRKFRNEQPYGTVPHKFNVTSRYAFSEGDLKGLFLGGAVRYQDAPFLQQDLRPPPAGDGRRYFGESTLFVDVFAGHRVKLPWFKSRLNVQLNVRNLLNNNLSAPGRYTTDFVQVRRVYLRDPRSWRVTTALDF